MQLVYYSYRLGIRIPPQLNAFLSLSLSFLIYPALSSARILHTCLICTHYRVLLHIALPRDPSSFIR